MYETNLPTLDELRAEQDHVNTQAKAKHSMEVQLGELEERFAEATDAANRGGRTAMAKLESRIRELEIELGNVQGRTGENQKGHQKAERKIKELTFSQEEDHKVLIKSLFKNLHLFLAEPRADARACGQAAEQGEELQEADRGGRGDRCPQPGKVQEGPARA